MPTKFMADPQKCRGYKIAHAKIILNNKGTAERDVSPPEKGQLLEISRYFERTVKSVGISKSVFSAAHRAANSTAASKRSAANAARRKSESTTAITVSHSVPTSPPRAPAAPLSPPTFSHITVQNGEGNRFQLQQAFLRLSRIEISESGLKSGFGLRRDFAGKNVWDTVSLRNLCIISKGKST